MYRRGAKRIAHVFLMNEEVCGARRVDGRF
jgi:hypothetical protein